MTRFAALAAAFLALAVAGTSSDGMAQGGCVARRESRQLIEQGLVMPFPAALRAAGLRRNQVVDVQLCQAGGGYVYRVRVLQPGGRVRAMNIPAG